MTTTSANALQTIKDVRLKMERNPSSEIVCLVTHRRELSANEEQHARPMGVPDGVQLKDIDHDIVVALPFHLWDTVKVALDWYEWAVLEAAQFGAAKDALHLDKPAPEEMSLTPQTNEPDPEHIYYDTPHAPNANDN